MNQHHQKYVLSNQQLIGLDDSYIDSNTDESVARPIHIDVREAFLELQKAAREQGFDLQIASGYRDFSRQLKIWKDKAEGRRTLLDDNECAVNYHQLEPAALLKTILRWSALPGASRHHWGTDIDIYDAAAVSENYEVQLTRAEVENGGPFSKLHDWLDQLMQDNKAYGFFRPYTVDRGGISPERWHLSYAPLAAQYQSQLKPEILLRAWRDAELPLLGEIEKRWEQIWSRYIWVDVMMYPTVFRWE